MLGRVDDRAFDKFLTAMAKRNYEAINPTLVERIISCCEDNQKRNEIAQRLGDLLRAADLIRGREYGRR